MSDDTRENPRHDNGITDAAGLTRPLHLAWMLAVAVGLLMISLSLNVLLGF